MIEAYYNFCHQVLNTSMYTIPLIIVSAVVVAIGLVHWRKQKKRQDEYTEKRGASHSAQSE